MVRHQTSKQEYMLKLVSLYLPDSRQRRVASFTNMRSRLPATGEIYREMRRMPVLCDKLPHLLCLILKTCGMLKLDLKVFTVVLILQVKFIFYHVSCEFLS